MKLLVATVCLSLSWIGLQDGAQDPVKQTDVQKQETTQSTTTQSSTTPSQNVKGVDGKGVVAKKTIKVIVDGKELVFGANGPREIMGRTMVPFRPLFESLGADVEYDLIHKQVTAEKENVRFELMIGEKVAKRNGAEIRMEVAPVLIKGTTFVPLRFVAEALDAEVDFNAVDQTITITTEED
ncbi:MAG: copper amine oxidase N-terminal domain-containing protein [Fimbriimonadales bacterium]|nr:copper amine oxidase N-terminal domain-containing protein [Fimbriimonadales bacterium]